MNDWDPHKNAEGYSDPTAYKALKNIADDTNGDNKRFHDLLNVIFTICELSDFRIEGRIVVRDKRTGKVWR